MTIKVEHESLLRVLERPSPSNYQRSSIGDEHFVMVDFHPQLNPSASYPVGKAPQSASFDDEDSILTFSTASLSDTDSDIERRVSFSEDIVTEEWTRPYTPQEDIPSLYYSTEETQRFRQDYRRERKALSEPPSEKFDEEDLISSTGSAVQRHRISRVVIVHNDKLETFFNPADSLTGNEVVSKQAPEGNDFFDNDSFWSGSITWY